MDRNDSDHPRFRVMRYDDHAWGGTKWVVVDVVLIRILPGEYLSKEAAALVAADEAAMAAALPGGEA